MSLNGPEQFARFEQIVLPHMDAAYNLARWLMRHEQFAEDAVQEAFLRAYEAFNTFRGSEPRAWLLTIVRNTCFTQLHREKRHRSAVSIEGDELDPVGHAPDPADELESQGAVQSVREAIDRLGVNLREVIVLREIEGLSYQQIATVVGVPIGTVMSRLSRARARLAELLAPREGAECEL